MARTPPDVSRRDWIKSAGAALGLVLIGQSASGQRQPLPAVTVFRSPSCGCCGKWSEKMIAHGFKVTEKNMDDVTPKKREHHVPAKLSSCHTAIAGAFVFEGHVPPDLVERVLREKPAALVGLAVPGMPQSAPGMDIGREPYEVIAFKRDGTTSVYAKRNS
jgi:hypothetical protein